jgi:riboflavin-specific deaminase-like protein
MALRRLHPDAATVTPEEAVGGLGLAARAPDERPYVVVNFVSTADGKAAVGGRSGPIGDEVDSALFHLLRTQVDAVLVGSGTLRAERYGRLVRDPALRELREREGLEPDPIACTITRSFDLPLDIPLFESPEQRAVVFTSAAEAPPLTGPAVTVERLDPAELTMTSVLRRLRAEHGVRSVLCEGGPTVFGLLLHEGMADELFLSLAPRIAGGAQEPTIVAGAPLHALVELELVWVLEARGSLYLRYRIEAGVQRAPSAA